MDLSLVPYGEMVIKREGGRQADPVTGGCRYRECMRNHAAAIGGQAYDGCGEFMPRVDGDDLEALKCAACGCHRSFHRREGFADRHRPFLLYNAGGSAAWEKKRVPTPPLGFPSFFPPLPHVLPLPFQQIHVPPYGRVWSDGDRTRGSETPPATPREQEQQRRERLYEDEAARAEGMGRKRYRTRFTQEQKEKMQAFAEKLGWKIQKQDDVALEEFCVEVGVKRHVLKVWMHNNKNTLASSKRDTAPSPQPIRV